MSNKLPFGSNLSLPSIVSGATLIVAFLLPLAFMPLSSDMFDLNKRMLVIALCAVAILVWSAVGIFRRKITLTMTPWTAGFIGLVVASVGSVVLAAPNKPAALLGMGGFYITLGLLAIAITSTLKTSISKRLISVLSYAGVALSIAILVDQFGFKFALILNGLFGLNLPATAQIHLTGSPLFSVFFLGVVLAMLVTRLFSKAKQSERLTAGIFGAIMVVGLVVSLVGILPGKPGQPQFLGALDSWSISTDVMKSPVSALVGAGTDSYADAFSVFRPAHLNQSTLWFVRYSNARDMLLEVLTTHGILGLLAIVFLMVTTLRLFSQSTGDERALAVGAVACVLIFIVFPPNTLMLSLFVLLVSAWAVAMKAAGHHSKDMTLGSEMAAIAMHDQGEKTRHIVTVSQLIGAAAALGVLFAVYSFGKAYAADLFFAASLRAATHNQAKEMYQDLVTAIQLNPTEPAYYRQFALANMTLAQGIAQNKNASDQDKQNALTLVQQAIQDAKVATTLDPANTANWDTLTTVYQALIGSAKDAESWTVASLVQQIQTDPTNPQLRFTLGSVYRIVGNTDAALQAFSQAAQLKPDFANAYFNIADIYGSKGDLQNQLAFLQQTQSVLPKDNADYAKVTSAIADVNAKIAAAGKKQAATTPTPETQTPATSDLTVATPLPVAKKAKATALPSDAGLPSPSPTGVPAVPTQ